MQNLVKSASHDDLPVVVSDPHDFLQIAQYASPELGERLVSVIDPPESVVYVGNDTADKQLAILRSYAPLQIYDFQSFTAEHPVFLLYSGSGGLGLDWWPRRLQQDGYTLRSVAFRPISEHDYLHRVMLVSRTKDSD